MPVLLGDIVICPAVAHRNAPEHAGTYEDELALLVVHGLLHLMGMDHQDDDEAEEMEARERELLARHYNPLRPEAWQSRAGADPASEIGSADQGDDGHEGPVATVEAASADGPVEGTGAEGVEGRPEAGEDGSAGHE
jgi:hypothetical protein